MLEVSRNQTQDPINYDETKRENIIVVKYEQKVEYTKDGRLEKRVPKKINITKMVNETKKVIKQDKAQETLAEIEKIFTSTK